MRLIFLGQAWEDYLYWQKTDKLMVSKINGLIKEILRTPFEGTGKPEPLMYNLKNCWSRRINPEHRLVYKIEGDSAIMLQCRYHY